MVIDHCLIDQYGDQSGYGKNTFNGSWRLTMGVYGGFQVMVVPQFLDGLFTMENPINMNDLGVASF